MRRVREGRTRYLCAVGVVSRAEAATRLTTGDSSRHQARATHSLECCKKKDKWPAGCGLPNWLDGHYHHQVPPKDFEKKKVENVERKATANIARWSERAHGGRAGRGEKTVCERPGACRST